MGYKENTIKIIKKLQKEQEYKERLLHYQQAKYLSKDLDLKSLKEWELDLCVDIHILDEDLNQTKEMKNETII